MDYPDRPSPGPGRGELVRAAILDRVGVQGPQEPGLAMAKDPQDRPNPYLPALAGAVGGDVAGSGVHSPRWPTAAGTNRKRNPARYPLAQAIAAPGPVLEPGMAAARTLV